MIHYLYVVRFEYFKVALKVQNLSGVPKSETDIAAEQPVCEGTVSSFIQGKI